MQHTISPPLFEKGGVQNLYGLSFVDPLTLFNSRNTHHIVRICQVLWEHGSLFKGGEVVLNVYGYLSLIPGALL